MFVTVQNITRTMATDWSSPERQKKEYMTWTVNFEAKNTDNVTMNYILETQGMYVEQQKEIQRKTVNGELVNVYVRSAPRDRYSHGMGQKEGTGHAH